MSEPLTCADLEISARTIYGEARGENFEGKLAVAHTLINRWRRRDGQWAKDDTLASCCLRHLQFSAWTLEDPNFQIMQQVGLDSRTFRECYLAILLAIDSSVDPTGGATHYHERHILPGWAAGHTPCAMFGNHLFYNDIP